MERERFDGADIAHLLHAKAHAIDWAWRNEQEIETWRRAIKDLPTRGARRRGRALADRAILWHVLSASVPTPFHRWLWILVATALLPTAALSAVALLLLQKEQEAEVARATIETTRAMASAVDGELRNTVAVAETLTVSDALVRGDLAAFYAEATRTARAHPQWVTIALSDRSGQQVLNVLQPLDAPLASDASRISFKRVVASAKPAVGDLETSGPAPAGFPVRVPVVRRSGVTHVLTIVVSPQSMLEVIERQRMPADSVVSILDSAGHHVARSRLHERFLGQPGSPPLRKLMRGRSEGWGSSITLEGQPIYAAFSRSARTGWSVAVGLPEGTIDAAVQQSFATVGFGLLLSLLLGALASLLVARLVTGPVGALRKAAQAVGRGEVPEVEPLRIAEVNEVAQALLGAARARKQAESTREETLERERVARAAAEEANRSKDQFLAMLGHELRNPLAAISSAIHVIAGQRGAHAEVSRERAQRVIQRQVDHLVRLVDDLLDVARVISGKVLLERSSVDVAELVRDAIADLRTGGHLDRHAVDADTESVWVSADPTRLEQVVNNLVLNAVKYTPAQGRIHVSVRAKGPKAVVEVSDDGVGISSALLPRIFDLFTQGQQSLDRAQGGLGIGLTLVRQLVELHGGSVRAHSSGEGLGSTFTIELPAIAAPAARASGESLPRSRPCHVLIVEDNDDSREMLKMLLEARGHRVDTAPDGPRGVELALERRPQVALVDLGLPGFDGFEVARRVRERLPREDIVLVALSGYGSAQDRQESQRAGFDLHLVKPVGTNTLMELLSDAVKASA